MWKRFIDFIFVETVYCIIRKCYSILKNNNWSIKFIHHYDYKNILRDLKIFIEGKGIWTKNNLTDTVILYLKQ